MVGHRRGAHVHHGGQIDDALLTVAQQPEDTRPAPVPHLLEDVGHRLKILHAGHVLQLPLQGLSVVVGRGQLGHRAHLSFDVL